MFGAALRGLLGFQIVVAGVQLGLTRRKTILFGLNFFGGLVVGSSSWGDAGRGDGAASENRGVGSLVESSRSESQSMR